MTFRDTGIEACLCDTRDAIALVSVEVRDGLPKRAEVVERCYLFRKPDTPAKHLPQGRRLVRVELARAGERADSDGL